MNEFETNEHNFLFSIVTAVYNVEEYLEEAILSVINQSLSFEKHVQLILINDGSPDNSDLICLKYKNLYPSNIVYVHKENGGVSSARNEGLRYIQGKYVNFMDADDKLSKNALEQVFTFFEKKREFVDIVSLPLILFDARTGEHILNYKFKKTRVIDLNNDFKNIQLHISSSFIKSEILRTYKFNESMKYAEDAELIARILADTCKLGVISSASYFYRQRSDNSSAIQMGTRRKEWYTYNLQAFSLSIMEYYHTRFGYVPKFIQYAVVYDLKWRLELENVAILNHEEFIEFQRMIVEVLKKVDDSIIWEHKHLRRSSKLAALKLKHNDSKLLANIYTSDDIKLYFNNIVIDSLKQQSVIIELINFKNNKLYIEGYLDSLFDIDNISIKLNYNNDIKDTKRIDRSVNTIISWGNKEKENYGFKAEISLTFPIQKPSYISFSVAVEDQLIPVNIQFKRLSGLNKEISQSYIIKNSLILSCENEKIKIERNGFLHRLKKEGRFINYLLKCKEVGAKKAALARCVYNLLKPLYLNKEIWLFMDRQINADDNAEHLFKYSVEQKDNIKKIFVISKESDDFKKMKQYGKVVSYGSYKHKMLQLFSTKLISSHADEWVINPFFNLEIYYRDLFNFNFVFLQHGITKDDMSKWLHKYNKNISLFTTASKLEYNSILNGNYNYNENVVKLTGFPRFDKLKDDSQKKILIAPTWRKNIVSAKDQKTGVIPYNNSFKNTVYFKMYNELINHKKLLDVSKKYGYEILFFPHPDIVQQLDDFTKNQDVRFVNRDVSYQELFSVSNLLITDYSSVFFDFSYLRKPVLYFQFDEAHYEKDYFDYETMGFGEVCRSVDDLVNYVINYIENDCKMKRKYLDRIDQFYAYSDRKNCERLYNEIINLEK